MSLIILSVLAVFYSSIATTYLVMGKYLWFLLSATLTGLTLYIIFKITNELIRM